MGLSGLVVDEEVEWLVKVLCHGTSRMGWAVESEVGGSRVLGAEDGGWEKGWRGQ